MSDLDRSIHVHGPLSELDEFVGSSADLDLGFDINSTNPLEDLWCLFRRPKVFFSAFKNGPRSISAWAWSKSGVGALLAVWISAFLEHSPLSPRGLFSGLGVFDSRVLMYAEQRWHLSSLLPKLGALLAAFSEFLMLASPIFKATALLSATASLCIGLRFFGIPWKEMRIERLFLRGLYLHWYLFLAFLPGLGALAPLLVAVFSVLSVMWIFDLKFLKALYAAYVVQYAIAIFVMLLLAVPMIALGLAL